MNKTQLRMIYKLGEFSIKEEDITVMQENKSLLNKFRVLNGC